MESKEKSYFNDVNFSLSLSTRCLCLVLFLGWGGKLGRDGVRDEPQQCVVGSGPEKGDAVVGHTANRTHDQKRSTQTRDVAP